MSKRKLVVLGCIGMLAMSVVIPINVSAQDVKAYEVENEVMPRGTQYIWCYKTENGKTYRRLWDTQRKKWLTDWILC